MCGGKEEKEEPGRLDRSVWWWRRGEEGEGGGRSDPCSRRGGEERREERERRKTSHAPAYTTHCIPSHLFSSSPLEREREGEEKKKEAYISFLIRGRERKGRSL